jgi:hypothetical protein
MIPLRVCKLAVVRDAFDIRLEPGPRFERRTLYGAVKIDVEIYFQLAYVLFHPGKLLLELKSFFLLCVYFAVEIVAFKCHFRFTGPRGKEGRGLMPFLKERCKARFIPRFFTFRVRMLL